MSSGQMFVVGYYNANKFPINIFVSPLNGTFQLEPGEFIRTKATGEKINDPLFENYCGPNRLQREVSRTPVKMVMVTAPKDPSKVGFAGVTKHMEPKPQADITKPETGLTAFSSMEAAIKAGFARPLSPVPDSRIVESNSGIVPELVRTTDKIEFADSDVPNRPKIEGTSLPSSVVNIPPPAVTAPQPTPQQPEPIPTSVEPAVELVANEISGFNPQAIGAPRNLPEPKLTEMAESQTPPGPPTGTTEATIAASEQITPRTVAGKFSCPACEDPKGQNLRFRSQLADHIRRKHADQFDAIMSSVPKGN